MMKETNPDPGNYEGLNNPFWEFYFYTITGQRLVTIDCNNANAQGQPNCWTVGENVYFGSKMLVSNGMYVVTDRLGTVRANSLGLQHESFAYYPYGEERTNTVDSRDKFATYFRDAPGLDYADQRYYNAGLGRFWSPDPGGIRTANRLRPSSWNRYTYVEGDPVNFADPTGLFLVDCVWDGGCASASGNVGNYAGSWGATSGGAVMGGPLWTSELAAEQQFDIDVRTALGWIAGDDPSQILHYKNSDPGTQAAIRAAWGLASEHAWGSDCANYLSSLGISSDALHEAAATVTIYGVNDPALQFIPLSWFDPSPNTAGLSAAYLAIDLPSGAAASISHNMIVANGVPDSGISVTGMILHELIHIVTGWSDQEMLANMNASDKIGIDGLLKSNGCER